MFKLFEQLNKAVSIWAFSVISIFLAKIKTLPAIKQSIFAVPDVQIKTSPNTFWLIVTSFEVIEKKLFSTSGPFGISSSSELA